MDLSSLPEDQQKQLQQLQQQFEEHIRQQQTQQQEQQQAVQQHYQAYDPSQVQAYDQSYYAYYQYQDPQQSQQHDQGQQIYPYYQPDYANAYQQQPQQSQYPQQDQQQQQPVSAAFQQPGASGPQQSAPQTVESGGAPSSSGAVGPGGGKIQLHGPPNSFYTQQAVPPADQAVHPGMNPAAAAALAALAQLTQFAGTMDAAERAMAGLQDRQLHGKGGAYRPPMGGPGFGPDPFVGMGPMFQNPAMHPPVGGPPNRGGGRRGGRSFRGGGRGNFGNHLATAGGFRPPSRGRGIGYGRGGGRQKQTLEHGNQPPYGEAQPSAYNHEGAPPPKQKQVFWCELCSAECNTLEMLEGHNKGKRHQKNLERLESQKNPKKFISKTRNNEKPAVDSKPIEASKPKTTLVTESATENGKNENQTENAPTETVGNEIKVETEQENNQVGKPDTSSPNPVMRRFDNMRRGTKRKFGTTSRGGKRPARPGIPPQPKVVIPLICDLCNAKCDTREVFDRHISGKKHMAKLKRFQGHQAMYGPVGLQTLYPPNPITQTLLHQGPQQAFYPVPPASYAPPQYHPQNPDSAPPDAYAPPESHPHNPDSGPPAAYAPPQSHPHSGHQNNPDSQIPATEIAVLVSEGTGNAFLGSEGTGKAALGSEATGNVVLGSDGTGAAVLGSDGTGTAVLESEGTGNVVLGSVLGSDGTGTAVLESEGTGNVVLGSDGTGTAVLGSEGTGTAVLGSEGTGNAVLGSEGTRNAVQGSEGTGK